VFVDIVPAHILYHAPPSDVYS